MVVEFNICNFDSWLFGFHAAQGWDEIGEFYMFSIGLMIFEIQFIFYK
jgi:hypothetical protein